MSYCFLKESRFNSKKYINIALEREAKEDELRELEEAGFVLNKTRNVWYSEDDTSKRNLAITLCYENKNDGFEENDKGFRHYPLKLKVSDLADPHNDELIENWISCLKFYIFDYLQYEINKEDEQNDIHNEKDQEYAWRDCFKFLRNQLSGDIDKIKDFEFVFEFLIDEYWRRPDILIFTNKKIIVLEFKAGKANKDHFIKTREKYEENAKKRFISKLENYPKEVILHVVYTNYGLSRASNNYIDYGETNGLVFYTEENFKEKLLKELKDDSPCEFTDELLKN